MKILITGAGGYIGRNLSEYLQTNYLLYSPTRRELDLLDSESVKKYFESHIIDIVIHCALIGGSRKEEYENNALSDNIKMFFNIVRNEKHFKKMIHFGSGAEYDKRLPIIKVKEEDFDKRVPIDDYGVFKYICSKYIENSEKVINLRIFGLFGKYEDYRYRFISNAICRSLFSLPITLKKDAYFDYVFINDFLKIVEYFIENKPKYKFYNIGRGNPVSLLKIAKKINTISEKEAQILVKETGLQNEYTCSNIRLMNELKNFKFTNMDIALRELYFWYKANKAAIVKDVL